MSRYSKEIREQIRSEIKDMISDYENVYGCDLAYEMYNNDYYIIGTYKAKQELKKYFVQSYGTIQRLLKKHNIEKELIFV